VAKPNYAFEKRQRELAKKKKKEEKAQRKTHPRPDGSVDDGSGDAPQGEVAPPTGAAPPAPGG
jgi:hypothetical protein